MVNSVVRAHVWLPKVFDPETLFCNRRAFLLQSLVYVLLGLLFGRFYWSTIVRCAFHVAKSLYLWPIGCYNIYPPFDFRVDVLFHSHIPRTEWYFVSSICFSEKINKINKYFCVSILAVSDNRVWFNGLSNSLEWRCINCIRNHFIRK